MKLEISLPQYDHIILSDDEVAEWTAWALRKAREKKHFILKEMEYAASLRKQKGYNQFNYEQLKAIIEEKAEKIGFIFDEHNTEIFEILCLYFSNDPAFEIDCQFSFMKGIMLRGNVGCGKTTLLKLFQDNSFRPFSLVPCRDITYAYVTEGAPAIQDYSSLKKVYPQMYFGHEEIGYGFDDLGTEDDKKNFGNSANVMLDVLLSVYDKRTFANFTMTTNLGGEQIEAIYGKRLRSRLKEMYNILDFSPEAPDRRQ